MQYGTVWGSEYTIVGFVVLDDWESRGRSVANHVQARYMGRISACRYSRIGQFPSTPLYQVLFEIHAEQLHKW